MKRFHNFSLLPLALAAVLSGCSHADDDAGLAMSSGHDGPGVMNPVAVGFDAYTLRNVTRAGLSGELITDSLRLAKEKGGGFGVFAYYTDAKYYTQEALPQFMWNQGVFYDGSLWAYEPLKYWPNEFGSDAQSADEDLLTFFAYAPYVEADVQSGKVTGDATSGITALSRNTAAGDPLVRYIASLVPGQGVDLCWGVCENGDREWQIIQDGSRQMMEAGYPWLDVQHPAKTDQKLKFTFKHALSQLNIQIDADPDIASHDETTAIAAGTKVYVRSISFTGFSVRGALNLNNAERNVARWMDYNGQGLIGCSGCSADAGGGFLFNDGRKNGKEGAMAAANEKNCYLNPTIISDDGNTQEGVTHLLKNLLDTSALEEKGISADDQKAAPVMVIPNGEPMTVTISYDVETEDPALPGYLSDGQTHGSSVGNVITKEISFGSSDVMENGKKYTVKLHLGLNSVKFDAAVSDWTDASAEAGQWLPGNVAPGLGMTVTPDGGSGAPITINPGDRIIRNLANGPQTFNIAIEPDDDNDFTITNSNPEVATMSAGAAPSRAGTRSAEPEVLHGVKTFTMTPLEVGVTNVTVTSAAGSITFIYEVVANAGLGATISDWTGSDNPENIDVTEQP